MTEQELLEKVAKRSMSCIKCDIDFDRVTGFQCVMGQADNVMEQADNLLNKLHKENQQIKDTNTRCCNEYSYFHKRMMKLEKENEQLKQLIKETLESTPIEHSLAVKLKNSIKEMYK